MKYKSLQLTDAMKDNIKFDVIRGVTEILIRNDNLKPYWVEFPAKFTEFHIKRNKENLLIVIGESWTYGETLPGIATAIQKYDFESQLELSYGPRLASMLDTDLYQYAVPGNCNFYMFTELERILAHVSTQGYKQIRVCIQMTEPGREQALIAELTEKNHPLKNLLRTNKKITFESWLAEYDDIFFDQYEQILSQYTNVTGILWKNFCKINSKNIDRKFKIIDKSWIQYSSNIFGKTLEAPGFYSIGWLNSITKDRDYELISFDKSSLLKEMDLIETSNEFIKANSLHSNHPNPFGHLLWAQYLARKSGWKNDI